MSGRALSGEQWVIAAAGHEATVTEVGGGLRGYSVQGEPRLDGYAEDEVCPAAAGQQLAPWPNRTGDGRYSFAGVDHQLPLTEPDRRNAIHGLVRWLPWRRISTGAESIMVSCEPPPQPGYPWPLSLTTRWSVSAFGLRAEHTATNLGDRPAPFGFGCHPYLLLPAAVDDLVLHVPADTLLRKDDRALPVGDAAVEGSPEDFSTPRPIGGTALDATYTGLVRSDSGTTDVRLSTKDGEGLELWADESFGWIQVFTGDPLPAPRTRRSVAVEPMTCPPDALRTGRDLVVLEPGQTWRGSWGIRPVS